MTTGPLGPVSSRQCKIRNPRPIASGLLFLTDTLSSRDAWREEAGEQQADGQAPEGPRRGAGLNQFVVAGNDEKTASPAFGASHRC